MKKAFLFLTMLLFAFMGTMRADEVTVCDGTATNDYVPVYGLYADTQGCQSEFVIPASEIGILPGGQISKLTFYLSTPASAAWTATFQVYMTEIEGTTLSAFVGPSGCTQVYQGALNGTGSTMEVVFDNDYTYNGGNLLIGTFVSTAGNYKSAKFYGVTAAGASIQRNSSGASTSQRNFLPKTTFEFVQGDLPATTIVPSENPVQLGVRPIGAWMKPYELAITNQGTPTTVTGVDGTANFAVEAEVPYALGYNGTMPISVTTTGTPAAGTLNGQVLVSYSDRTFTTIDATAEMYEPVDGDVWEMAEEVTAMPFQGSAPTGIYRNYELGQADDAADAVYKVTFDNDVLFSAGTNGAGAKTRLYTEDFNGVGGPDADNNYVYNGPTVNPGPMQMWFAYAYSGTNTWYGLSAGGGYYYGYQIPASYIEELGLAGTSITTVEAAARESYDYECYIVKGGATPFDGELVSFGVAENPQAMYFFDINLEEPVLVDEGENIWVIFYSDSPYAAYCGRTPVDATNGKIWTYNPNATSPAWSSNTSYTPVIYTRFLELPTGREVTVDLGSMKIKEGNGVMSEVAAIDGTAMGTPKAEMKKANRGNRDMQTILEEGWESGLNGWTLNHCHNNTGVTSAYTANTGSYVFRFYYTTAYPQYLISPELSDNNGGIFSFYAAGYDTDYTETFQLGYSTTTNDPSAFTWGSELSLQNEYEYAQYSSVFPAGTKYVAIACTSDYQYYLFIDDILVTAEGGGTPEPPTATYQIADLYVPAGTYYVAVASTTEEFNVDMAVAEVPAPEQAVVISPADGEANVATPYLAEWILGDYTEEMQVLVGTQYPPQTVMIDWTDYLVESAFLLDLEPNQSYFMQVNARNASGTTYGEIIAFTTPIDGVTGFAVENEELYPGETAVFTWDANRSFKGYNLYMSDGNGIVKVNESLITTNTYPVEGLEYNMDGYYFAVTAVYDAGESNYSNVVTVKMTGNGTVSGVVYEQDSTTVIPNAIVEFRGTDAYGAAQVISTTADENGAYTCEVLEGNFTPVAYKDGYAECTAAAMTVAYGETYNDVNIYVHEFYYPLGMITATEDDANVLVEWSWTPAEMLVDFETGDFSQADFNNTGSTYPWAITTVNPYEGTYAMKSTCEGIASGVSYIEATVEVPYDALMGFWVRVSSETNYDMFRFYIDGVQQGAALSGELAYSYKEYAVTEGTHTYKWEYTKDGSVNSNDDCVYVDNIYMYKQAGPQPSGQTYNFDDETMMGWTSIDADSDGYGWVSSGNPGQYHNAGVSLTGNGHDSSAGFVLSGSYSNAVGLALTPDNYLVSPFKMAAQSGAAISFWACAQDASYAAEHFGVAVSTTGNTSGADFTTIQEWTMTAKSMPLRAENEVRGTRVQGSWYQYTVDLSAYAGQEIWVAIRHFNCTDMFILNVDDITLGDGSDKAIARGERTLQSFNLYRRNNIDNAEPTLIATPATDVFEYTDAAWANLPYGEYQWGIQATYEGNAPEPNRDDVLFTDDFEAGNLNSWTLIDNGSPAGQGWAYKDITTLGWGDGENAHSGVGVASSWSWNNYSITQDSYMITPLVEGATSINYFVNVSSAYPDHYQIMASSTGTNTSDFTVVFEETPAKSSAANGAVKRSMTKGGNTRFDAWIERTVDLPAGTKYVAFHHDDYDMNYLFIDDVTVYGGSAPVPTPVDPGDGLSEIIWSNVIEKDMVAELTFNVALNNGQSPVGAEIAIVGDNTYSETVDETGVVVMEVRKGTYDITVALPGYATYAITTAIEQNTMEFNIVLEEVIAPVENLYVSATGWATWAGSTASPVNPVTPTPPTGDDNSFTEAFTSGLNGWTTIDADGDGNNWFHSTAHPDYDYSGLGHNGDDGFIISASYSDGTGASYNANNYIVTPQKYEIVAGSTLTFWADYGAESYPDYFEVVVSTNGNTSASDFTMVWGGTAKSMNNNKSEVRFANNRYNNWRLHTVDLSAYAGQQVWIGLHHEDYDMYEIWIDDVELSAGSKNREALSYKVMLDGQFEGETTYCGYQHNVEGMEEGSEHVTAVAPLYASGMGDWSYYTWTYASCSNYAGVTDYTATVENQDVTLTWTLNGAPTPPPTPGEDEEFNFDDETMMGWTSIDADGDGYGWVSSGNPGQYHNAGVSLAGTGHNASQGYVISGSYSNSMGIALTPDNYLVSPTKAVRSQISFWACAQDASYAAEHFGVAVSTGGATASEFTMVQEWTMTAKGEGAKSIGRDGQTRAQGSWYEYTVDLSAYAGQEIWVAIRHFNCTDMFILNVDDITLTANSKNRDGQWYYYDNGTNNVNLGLSQGAGNFYWGVMFPAGSYEGNSLSKISYYDNSAHSGEIYIYQGGDTAPGTLAYTQAYTTTGAGSVIEIAMNDAVDVDNTQNLWVVMHNLNGGYPGSADSGPGVTNGGWISADGSTWYGSLYEATGSYDANWMIRAYIESGAPIPSGDVLGVMIWRDGEPLTMAPITATTFTDSNVVAGEHDYCIRVVYSDYAMSCEQCETVTVGSSCDPVTNLTATYYNENGQEGGLLEWEGNANSYNVYVDSQLLGSTQELAVLITGLTLNQTYIMGIVAVYDDCESEMVTVEYKHGTLGVVESEIINAIYPNPTSGDLHIYAEAMTRVSVYNAMGQMVYDQETSGNEMTIDMGQFESGVYMVKVTTETGSSVKRITVAK